MLDLVSPSMHSDDLPDLLYEYLQRPVDSLEVLLPPSHLLPQLISEQQEVEISLAHGADLATCDLLELLSCCSIDDGIYIVR